MKYIDIGNFGDVNCIYDVTSDYEYFETNV